MKNNEKKMKFHYDPLFNPYTLPTLSVNGGNRFKLVMKDKREILPV